ncbi:hypothetical protein ACWGKW_44340 [Streptomyces sp. NPDC054766]
MFQEAPIYRQLVAERGDVPAQVRDEAERIGRDLQQVITPLQVSAPPAPERVWPSAPAGLALTAGAQPS